MKLKSILSNQVKSDYVALTKDAEGHLLGGFGTIDVGSAIMPLADNNCVCTDNNCDCPGRPQTRPTNNCGCPNGSGDFTPKSGGNNCECKSGVYSDNCSCPNPTSPASNSGLLPSLF